MLCSFYVGISLTHPMLTLFLCGEFLLHIPCCLHVYRGVSPTHSVCIDFYARSFSYTSHFAFVSLFFVVVFIRGVSLTHAVLVSFLYRGSFPYTSRAGFIFILGVSLTHPMLISHLSGEFLLHIPCWLSFSVGSFSYTSRGWLHF